ncbi:MULTISPECIES: helix-turn-helix domain-containing protein [Pacificibacter]|uniref:helix-turn-helix domain-containing protein n=1 Tax=Pacificibacter TaxID=1042323 RepID=UPI001C093EB3|nr:MULTISPECIES: helix-turn-helix transcriptional regulator [Pacificibacter]MBU2936649.1 helix-turn-helix domain-containing protein [Pacificibacter marinus]MDO6614549.1 helix-turn-helix transcriptional regulator [Pacificibacter sp. 1_MG-2023]
MSEISENLRLLCSFKTSISQVSRDLGINRSQLNRYLAGTSTPRTGLMRKICDYFGVEMHELMLPPKDFAELIQLRGLDSDDSTGRMLRQYIDKLMASNEPRIQNMAGTFWEYYQSMSQPGKVIRNLITFEARDHYMFYRRLERMGPHDKPCHHHFRYQGAALMTGDRIFMSDHEYGAEVELTQTVLYPDYSMRWTRLHGIKLGVSADSNHMPCAVRVVFERPPHSMHSMTALRHSGLFDRDSPHIPEHVLEMIDNTTSGPHLFEAYSR